MSCLFACFSTSKHERRRRRQLLNATSPNHHRNGVSEAIQSAESLKQEDFHIPITPLKVSEEKVGEREILNWNGKKVSFNLNVKTLGELSAGREVTDNLLKKDGENENQKEETSKETKCSVSDLTVSSSVCKPQKNNRYQDCAESDGECEDLGMEEEGLDVDNGGSEAGSDKKFIIEESSESLFSLSIESREQVVEAELDDKEVTSPMQMGKSPSEELKPMGLNRDARDRSQYVDSVLNPVENLAQWKAVKVKASTPLQQQGKENIILEEEFDMAFSSKAGRNETMLVDKEIAVDTSLSSWLVGSETTPVSNASSNSVGNSQPKKVNGDRCILGVLVMEELKQHSVPVSRSGSKGWSPDETPVIGTIGSYWSHTGQAVDSNSRSPSKGTPNLSRRIEDEGVKWNATPFEARLEGALDKIVAAEV